MTIEVIINGSVFNSIKDIKVTKSIDSIAGSFEFVTAVKNLTGGDFKAYSPVFIMIDGTVVLSGYIDPQSTSYTRNTHSLTVGGFGNLVDLVDVSVNSNTQYVGPMTFLNFCKKVIADNGLDFRVIDKSDGVSFTKEEIASSETGASVFEFLDKYAKLKGVLLSSDGESNLVIFNSTGINSGVSIINIEDADNNNIIKAGKTDFKMRNRFSKIIVKSQGGTDGWQSLSFGDVSSADIQGEATDSDVSRNRVKVIISKTATDIDGCTKQAVWEVNKRRSDSVNYGVSVFGHAAFNGEIWEPGMQVSVNDTYADIESNMLLKSVVYNWNKGTGTTSDLVFVANDAYKLQAEDPTKSINKVGENVI